MLTFSRLSLDIARYLITLQTDPIPMFNHFHPRLFRSIGL